MATPRLHSRRTDRPTNGPGVAAIAEVKGRPLMPWQADAVDVALELDPATGLYWYGIVVVTVQRQAGKTDLESSVADHRCLTTRRGRAWITMQNGKTVDSWMREEHFTGLEAAGIFGRPGSPDCRYTLSRRAGEVGVRWPGIGSTFLTFPPKRDALHSKQSDLVVVDEAWVHNDQAGADLRQAIRPTMATRPGAQLWIVSTEGDDTSAYLDQYLTRARALVGDPTARVCLVDYGIGADDDPEDLDVIAAAHPAIGHTITMDSLRAAREDFENDAAGWARAYGNRPTKTRVLAIPASVWSAAQVVRTPVPSERVGLAFDASPAGDHAALVAAWGDDPTRVEVLWEGKPDRATVDLLVQVGRARGVPILADRGSYAALEILEAVRRKADDLALTLTSMGEYAAACSTLLRSMSESSATDGRVVVHSHPALDTAVANATRRPLGDGAWGWGRKEAAGSIAPLVAGTLAVRAWNTLPEEYDRSIL